MTGEYVTMRDLVEATPELEGETFDYALPQSWVDDVVAKTGDWPYGFVWHYPQSGAGHIWGKPFPVTEEARTLLATYEEVTR